MDEQFVYSRLPKDYFLADAEEQIDIDVAIDDIKQMRQDFMEYVNSQDDIDDDDLGFEQDFQNYPNLIPDLNQEQPLSFNTRDADQHAD